MGFASKSNAADRSGYLGLEKRYDSKRWDRAFPGLGSVTSLQQKNPQRKLKSQRNRAILTELLYTRPVAIERLVWARPDFAEAGVKLQCSFEREVWRTSLLERISRSPRDEIGSLKRDRFLTQKARLDTIGFAQPYQFSPMFVSLLKDEFYVRDLVLRLSGSHESNAVVSTERIWMTGTLL